MFPIVLGLIAGIAAVSAAGAADGGHRVSAKPPGNPTATPAPTATATPCPTCPTMHVDYLHIAAYYNGYNRNELAGNCVVTVKDEAGNWVEGAVVTIRWGGYLSGTYATPTVLTGAEGGTYSEANFYNSVSGRCRSGDSKISSCTVVNVFKDGMSYDPAQNVVEMDTNDHCRLD